VNISIIGLGLIGGSIGLAMRAALPDAAIRGLDVATQTIAAAMSRGAIGESSPTIEEAVSDADLVIIATPVLATRSVFESIAAHLRPGAIVTDAGSTKAQVLEWARESLPDTVAFVGGHPMAGSERHGVEHARADLFRGAVWCLTPLAGAPVDALESLEELVQRIGARPLRIDAMTHDAAVAAVSHLPFVLSAALVRLTAADPDWPVMSQLAATGYRDMSRLASGDARMHRDICLTNPMIAPRLREMARLLDDLADRMDDSQQLESFFEAARGARESWLRDKQA
jgi:prephenate dehydrogenase